MAQIHYIKDLYENEDLSLREIARRTEHSFATVQKYAYQEDWSGDTLPNVAPEDYPILGAYIPYINEWMEADRKVPRKQRHTARRIYDRLCKEKGYTGSYSSVKRNAFCSFPAVFGVGLIADEIEIAAVRPLAQRTCPPEIRVGQVPEVDHIRMAEHRAELHAVLLLKDVAIPGKNQDRVVDADLDLCAGHGRLILEKFAVL